MLWFLKIEPPPITEFIKKKKLGPKMNPWGTPQWIGSDEEEYSPIDTGKTCEPDSTWTMTETNSVLPSR